MAKVFQIFVPDDKLVSRIISSENQITELFVIDRSDKDFVLDNMKALEKPALYILINRELKQLYVGETDDSFRRLKNHEAKDFWTEAIVFHSTSNTFTVTEVMWLEAKTYEVLSELGYYDLSQNKQKPAYPKLKRHQIYTLKPLFEEAKNYICAAGFDIFIKKKERHGIKPRVQELEKYNPHVQEEKREYVPMHPSVSGVPFLEAKKNTLQYYTAVRSKFIKNILAQLNKSENIFDITNLDELEELRIAVANKEQELGMHNTYACSIKLLKRYIERGFTHKEFEHDAMLVKELRKRELM